MKARCFTLAYGLFLAFATTANASSASDAFDFQGVAWGDGNESSALVLTCVCHGGPGGYPYACEPIAKTCYGGPGNYPYTCWVCPQ